MNYWPRESTVDGGLRRVHCAMAIAFWVMRHVFFINADNMARGWESKSVEDQMEEARRSQGEPEGRIQTPEERERLRKVESLRLERSRLVEQLNRARSETHQRMIQQSLKAIEEEITTLSAT